AGHREPGPPFPAARRVGDLDEGGSPTEAGPLLDDPAGDRYATAGELVAPPAPVDHRQQPDDGHAGHDGHIQDAQRHRRRPLRPDPHDRGRYRHRRQSRARSSATRAGTAWRQSAVTPTSAAANTGAPGSGLMARIVPADRTPTMWLNLPERATAT